MSHFGQAGYAVFRERLAVIQRRVNRIESLMEQEQEKRMEVDFLMKQALKKLMEVDLFQFRVGLETKAVLEELQDLESPTATRHRRLYSSSDSGSQLESCDYGHRMLQDLDAVGPETCDGPSKVACDSLHPYKQRATEMIDHDSGYTSDTDSDPSPCSPENWSANESESFLSEEDGEAELCVEEEPKRRRRNTL